MLCFIAFLAHYRLIFSMKILIEGLTSFQLKTKMTNFGKTFTDRRKRWFLLNKKRGRIMSRSFWAIKLMIFWGHRMSQSWPEYYLFNLAVRLLLSFWNSRLWRIYSRIVVMINNFISSQKKSFLFFVDFSKVLYSSF